MAIKKGITFHCMLLIFVVGLQSVLSDVDEYARPRTLLGGLIDRARSRPRGALLKGGTVDVGFHKKVTYPSLGVIRNRPIQVNPTIIEQGRPMMIQNEVLQSNVNYEEPSTLSYPSKTISYPSKTISYPSSSMETSGSTIYGGEQQIDELQEHRVIAGKTRVVNEENQHVVEEVKRHVIEEKVPTIIKTKTPTYIQDTMEQKVIREQVPRTVQEEETKYVTETKPIYVTQRRPVTVRKNKTYLETRERVVNVPGRQIITKGPTTVTRERGQGSYRIIGDDVDDDDNAIGFRFLAPSAEKRKPKTRQWNPMHLNRKIRTWRRRRPEYSYRRY